MLTLTLWILIIIHNPHAPIEEHLNYFSTEALCIQVRSTLAVSGAETTGCHPLTVTLGISKKG